MPETETIQPLHTPCLDCVFAVFEDKTQTGCELGRLETYREQGSVLPVFDAEGNEFEVINGRLCTTFRHNNGDWARQYPTNRREQVREEIQLRATVLVLIECNHWVRDLPDIVRSLREQTLPAHEVIFINCQCGEPASKIHADLVALVGDSFPWKLTDILPDENGDRKMGYEAIDEVFSKVRGQYYVAVSADWFLPKNYLKNLDEALNDRLERFVVVRPYKFCELNGLAVQTAFHKNPSINGSRPMVAEGHDLRGEQIAPGIYGDGNPTPPCLEKVRLDNILDKAELLAKVGQSTTMVIDAEALCPIR